MRVDTSCWTSVFLFFLLSCGHPPQVRGGLIGDTIKKGADLVKSGIDSITGGIIPATKCYGTHIGCMTTGGVFYDLIHRPLQSLPWDRDKLQTAFLLFTRTNHQAEQILVPDNNITVRNSMFDATKETKVIVHGYLDNGRLPWVMGMKDEYLKKGDYNVIIVDWWKGSQFPYTQATANTRLVGAEIAYLILTMQDVVSAVPERFHIIGHSLGAHVAGYAGERLKFLGRISGLDPADPYFSGTHTAVRLDDSDALFVDVIHTDADSFLNILINEGGFGLRAPAGHVDFYPNGGEKQPGCNRDLLSTVIVKGIFEGGKQFVACDHLRSYKYFTDSINNLCKYNAYPCLNYKDFQAGRCTGCGSTGCSYMGEDAVKRKPPKGMKGVTYYLETGGKPPLFCRYEIFIQMELSAGGGTERGKLYAEVRGSNSIGTTMTLLHDDKDKDFAHGKSYFFIIASKANIGKPREVLFKWEHHPSWLKPWQWGLIHDAKLLINKMTVIDGESQQSSVVCSPNDVNDGVVVRFKAVNCTRHG